MSGIVSKDGEVSRKQVWLSAWLGVATSDSCRSVDVATNWADRCLREFDKRFPQGRPDDKSMTEDKPT